MVIVPIGAGGQISIYNDAGTVDVLVDVLGWYPTGNTYTGLNPARLLDTRLPPPAPPAAVGALRNLLVVTPGGQQMAGQDRIAVWVCDVPANTVDAQYRFSLQSGGPTLTVDPTAVAVWAQQTVAPYYASVSNGRYRASFTALGRIPLGVTDGSNECLDKAVAATGPPYTNVFVTDTSTIGNGVGSPGLISSYEPDNFFNFTKPPVQTQRGFWVGGGSTVDLPAPNVVIHEIGHTLKWPHSYVDGFSEYNNPTDVMSGTPDDGWCSITTGSGYSTLWPCIAQNTLAFNRFAAGWVDENQVQLQQSGTQAFTFGVPSGGGTQMVVAPDPGDSRVMLTLEGRPRIGNDRNFPVEGVVAHIIDQRPGRCFTFSGGPCVGTDRRQSQAIGAPDSYDHVLQVGTTTVIDGITITVTGKTGDSFTGQVSGTFIAPSADLPAPDARGSADQPTGVDPVLVRLP